MIFERSLGQFTKTAGIHDSWNNFTGKAGKVWGLLKTPRGFAAVAAAGAAGAGAGYLTRKITDIANKAHYKDIENALVDDPERGAALSAGFIKKHNLGNVEINKSKYVSSPSAWAALDGSVGLDVPENPRKGSPQISDPVIYLHELGHVRGVKSKHPVSMTNVVANFPGLSLASGAKPALSSISAAVLAAEEARASRDALSYLKEHGTPDEQRRAKKLLAALHRPYMNNIWQAPLVAAAATAVGIPTMLAILRGSDKHAAP